MGTNGHRAKRDKRVLCTAHRKDLEMLVQHFKKGCTHCELWVLRFLGVPRAPDRKKQHQAKSEEPPLGDTELYVLNENAEFVLRSSFEAGNEESNEE